MTVSEMLDDVRNAIEPFIALLDPLPPRGDHVEVASLTGDDCDNVCNAALSLTMADFRALRSAEKMLTTLRSQLSGTTEETSGWQPIETARKVVDETVLLRVEHMNYAIAAPEDKHRWEEVCSAYWTDFNSGGWVWHGLAGSPTHWMPIPPLGAHP